MNTQKQIEEMAKDICSPCHKGKLGMCEPKEGCIVWQYAKNAVEQGYRKITENAVVVPDMADKDFYTVEKSEWDKMVQGAKDIIREKEEKARKETAEKFAERVKMAFYYEFDESIPSIMADKIDEICKEITGTDK